MQFNFHTDAPLTVMFEPTGMHHDMQAGDSVLVKFFDGDDGEVCWQNGMIVFYAPRLGYVRAWAGGDKEIDIGPESVDHTP